MNWRIKSLDDILANAEKKGLSRTLGGFQLMMLGIGAVIGTGIFVLTAEAAQKAGPGMMLSFVIAGFVCAVTALCYAELASMVPVSGSAYTYSYAVLGEIFAWLVGWALILEYAVAASAVSVGWSNYFVPLVERSFGVDIPLAVSKGPFAGGVVNLPAILIAGLVTWLLYIGTRESARVNATLVVIKVVALVMFIALAVPVIKAENFEPFMPLGFAGVSAAAASIFFAYVGFDAVSTAAEETRDPQRNIPIGLIGSLAICTIFYLLVAAGAIGSIGAQPVMNAAGVGLTPGTPELVAACKEAANANAISCSDEALAHVLREIGWEKLARLIGLAAFLALPSVILTMLFGQTRVFFAMSRDGLLPAVFSKVHTVHKTPYVITVITGIAVAIAAAFLPVGRLADYSNAGTLFAFFSVALGVMILRIKDPNRVRKFRTPAIFVTGPLALIGCLYLFFSLNKESKLLFVVWAAGGLLVYFLYGYRRSHIAPRNV
jgi:APA family basic amino acid/polyamine antiporter